jgi:hypothetical protein
VPADLDPAAVQGQHDRAAVQGLQVRADELVPADLDPAAVEGQHDRAAVQGLRVRADELVPADLDPAAVEGLQVRADELVRRRGLRRPGQPTRASPTRPVPNFARNEALRHTLAVGTDQGTR